ncbi:MAG: fliC [Bacteriovoracaceae bacterium]|nr:fliC [Bacteriovoracaceae bacterium]
MFTGLNYGLTRLISRDLTMATNRVASALEKLTSGNRINSIFDGTPADTSMITKLDAQARGIRQAILNVNEVTNITNTADVALSGMLNDAYTLRELAQKARDPSLTSTELSSITTQASGLISDLNNYVTNTTYTNANGLSTSLLDNSFGSVTIQAGANRGNTFSFSIGDARTSTLGQLAIYSGAQNSISSASSGQVVINGTTIGASVTDGLSTSSSSNSSIAIVNAINGSQNTTGVYAESAGTTQTLVTNFSGASLYSGTFSAGDFKVNSVSIVGTISSAVKFVSAINGATSQTGVIAALNANGTDVSLTASDGRNIQLVIATGGVTASNDNVYNLFNISSNAVVLSSYASLSAGVNQTYVGAVRIWSSSAITISGSGASAALGITSGTKALVSGTSVSAISLSSTSSATQATKVLDATIAQISTLRSQVGAVHDRIDYTASFLLESQNATNDAKGAIQNVDFATETANLVMAQILQDSGVAALTQANLSQSTVYKLLQNL